MSSESLYTRVPAQKGHDHFYESIAGFPELPTGPTFEQKNQYIKDTLRYQIITGNPEKAKKYINMRQCFKLEKKKYVEFCLAHKVPGVSFTQAATQLGYRK